MVSLQDLVEELNSLMEPIIKQSDLELFDIKVRIHRSDYIIEVFLDRECGGMSLDECSSVHQNLIQAIDEGIPDIAESYSLELSSPGLDAPLQTSKDFRRVTGKDVEIFFKQPFEGKETLSGHIKEVKEEFLIIESKKEEHTVPYHVINKGLQII